LIYIRTAVETNNDSKSKISALRTVMRKKQYDEFIDRHGGKDKYCCILLRFYYDYAEIRGGHI
jgi:hypothetical protein